jgi:hypothetical protein
LTTLTHTLSLKGEGKKKGEAAQRDGLSVDVDWA